MPQPTEGATQLSILVPVFNEEERLRDAIEQILSADLPVTREIIIVDDGSTDASREILRTTAWPEDVRVVFHERNRGKGAAVRTALGHARGRYSAIMDADLEYQPEDIGVVLQPILDHKAVAAFGTRAFESHSSYSFWYVVGNKSVTFAANLLFNAWLSDIMTCHKVLPTELFRSLDLRERGFAIEGEIAARLLKRGIRIYEVPVSYTARDREDGKKLTARDGIRVLGTLLRCRVR